MEKKELVSILNEVLDSIGFKKKGNYWVLNNDIITKMVNLQKSQFNNSFYINYGYIIKSIPLGNLMMHIYNRLASSDDTENRRITELLDLENNISNTDREKELRNFFLEKLIVNIQSINTEQDLLTELKKRPHLNNIPLAVKEYFSIKEL